LQYIGLAGSLNTAKVLQAGEGSLNTHWITKN